MKKNIKGIFITELIILIFILILKIVVLEKIPYLMNYFNMFFWFILAAILYLISGFPKDKNYLKGITIRYVIIALLAYLILVYMLGLFTGFTYSTFTITFKGILKNTLPVTIYVISREYIRYILCKKTGKNTKPIIVLTILYIIFGITMTTNGYKFSSFEGIFVYTFLTCIPLIARESLCSYITYNVSLIPTIIFSLAMELVVYVFPFYPALGDYLYSVLGLLFPFLLYYKISGLVKYKEKKNIKLKREIINLMFIPIFIVLMVLITLVSGIFSYEMIAIGSDSMNPIYYKGDAVIYKKIDDMDIINEKDILVFEYNNVIVTHRVKNIIKKGNVTYFQTKGDNNNKVDTDLISEEDVLGVVKYVVKYVGYPTIWINERF